MTKLKIVITICILICLLIGVDTINKKGVFAQADNFLDLRAYSINSDSATINWHSDSELTCVIEYTDGLSKNSSIARMVQRGTAQNNNTIIYETKITNLKAGTGYTYTAICNNNGSSISSDTKSFKTAAESEAVSISNIRECKMSDGGVKIRWDSNKLTSYNFVSYSDTQSGSGRSAISNRGVYSLNHEIILNLDNSKSYKYLIFSKVKENATSTYAQTENKPLEFDKLTNCETNATITPTTIHCTDHDKGATKETASYVISDRYSVTDQCNLSGLKVDTCSGEACHLAEGVCVSSQAGSQQIKCETLCYKGACKDGALNTLTETCIDGDRGEGQYDVRSKVHTKEGETYLPKEDYCLDDKTLMEATCTANGFIFESHKCNGTCSQGACRGDIYDTCIDSDGGSDYFVPGSTAGYVYTGNKIDSRDYCHDGIKNAIKLDKGTHLAEFFCVENTASGDAAFNSTRLLTMNYDVKCEFGCEKGACLKNPEEKIAVVTPKEIAKAEKTSASIDVADTEMSKRLKGKIILKVEDKGRSYYVNPKNNTMHYLGRPDDAFRLMREQGVGISNDNINKIPIGVLENSDKDSDGDGLGDYFEETLGLASDNSDSDKDGYSDKTELENGYDPKGQGKQKLDQTFSKTQAGRIFLQIEKKGEAWYINPNDNKRYFLGRPADSFNVMRKLGLGISNNDFSKVAPNEKSEPVEVSKEPVEEKKLVPVNGNDLDSDGLYNYEEENIYKSDPSKNDTDGDGITDGEEVRLWTNPNGEGNLPEPLTTPFGTLIKLEKENAETKDYALYEQRVNKSPELIDFITKEFDLSLEEFDTIHENMIEKIFEYRKIKYVHILDYKETEPNVFRIEYSLESEEAGNYSYEESFSYMIKKDNDWHMDIYREFREMKEKEPFQFGQMRSVYSPFSIWLF